MSLRMQHLSEMLTEVRSMQAIVWLKRADGFTPIHSVHKPGSEVLPDIQLLNGKSVLAEFDDQRVKLDLDTMKVEVKDLQGVSRTLVFAHQRPEVN